MSDKKNVADAEDFVNLKMQHKQMKWNQASLDSTIE